MKIALVGAGAMGCTHGAFLSKAGEEVWLVDQWESHIQAINRKGLILSSHGSEEIVRLKATTDASDVGIAELILFFVKSYDTVRAAHGAIPMAGPNTYAMTLQNSIGNAESYYRRTWHRQGHLRHYPLGRTCQ